MRHFRGIGALICGVMVALLIGSLGCAGGKGDSGSGDGIGGGEFGDDSSGWGASGAQVSVMNLSRATLQIEPYETDGFGDMRFPLEGFIVVAPGQSGSRWVALPQRDQQVAVAGSRGVALTVTASGTAEGLYGTWVVRNQGGAYDIQARDGDDGYVHLYWAGSGQEIYGQ